MISCIIMPYVQTLDLNRKQAFVWRARDIWTNCARRHWLLINSTYHILTRTLRETRNTTPTQSSLSTFRRRRCLLSAYLFCQMSAVHRSCVVTCHRLADRRCIGTQLLPERPQAERCSPSEHPPTPCNRGALAQHISYIRQTRYIAQRGIIRYGGTPAQNSCSHTAHAVASSYTGNDNYWSTYIYMVWKSCKLFLQVQYTFQAVTHSVIPWGFVTDRKTTAANWWLDVQLFAYVLRNGTLLRTTCHCAARPVYAIRWQMTKPYYAL